MHNTKNDKHFFIFTLPTLIMVLIITIIPFALNFYYSFFKWDGISIHKAFIGFGNFIRIFTKDRRFIKATQFTLRFSVFYIVIVNAIAFLLSLQLKSTNRLNNIRRAFFFIPHIISLTAVGLIWRFIFGPGFEGLYMKIPAEIFSLSWLGDKNLAFYSVLIVTIMAERRIFT